MSVARDRDRLFTRQAHAFGHLITGATEYQLAACPLCLGMFSTGDLQACAEHAPNVTIEHAPPKQKTRLGS